MGNINALTMCSTAFPHRPGSAFVAQPSLTSGVGLSSVSSVSRRYKLYSECSESQKKRMKVQLAQDCQPLVSSYLGEDYACISMAIWNAEECPSQREVIMFPQQDGAEGVDQHGSPSQRSPLHFW